MTTSSSCRWRRSWHCRRPSEVAVAEAVAEVILLDWPYVKTVMDRIRSTGEMEPLDLDHLASGAVLLDGHHRAAAADLLGWAQVPVRRRNQPR